MEIAMDKLCHVFSRALDLIEEEQLGTTEHHSARVATLCAIMGKKLNFDSDTLSALAICALFHDNALTEYHLSERENIQREQNLILHCEKGQNNVSWLPFKKNIDGFILYHHELGSGIGPFKKKEGEYPFEAALLAAADSIDVANQLQNVPVKELSALRDKTAKYAESYSTRSAVNTLLDILDENTLESLRDENISETLNGILPKWEVSISEPSVIGIANFAAHVIDYKSAFTQKHTRQIANRAWLMASYYGYDIEQKSALYLAASLHDIGKMATPTEILEKPGKLDDNEYEIIKKHVKNTHDFLRDIPDFDLIFNWASNHHEKLDGRGYPLGKPAEEMDFNSRLMACLDIYQAVCEKRPYHDERSHADTMPILYSMAESGFIDSKIVKDMDEVMAEYSLRDIPDVQDIEAGRCKT